MWWLSALAALVVVACSPSAARVAASADVASIIAVIPIGAGPTGGLAADSTAVWVPSDFDGLLSRIDPLTNQVSATIRIGPSPSCGMCTSGVALHERAVWATSSSARLAVIGINALTNSVADTVAVPVFPSAVTGENDGTLWLASVADSVILRIDPLTRRVIASISLPRPARLAVTEDALWATSQSDDLTSGLVVRIDRGTNKVVAKVEVGIQPVAIASGEGSIWVIDGGRQTLERIDPRSNTRVSSVPVGVLPSGVVAGDGWVWVVSHSASTVNGSALLRIDPRAEAVTESISLGEGTPVGLTMGAGSLWIASRNPDTVIRVDPLARPSTESGRPVELLIVVLSGVLLAATIALRWARRPSPSPLVRKGRLLSELQRFAAIRASH